MLYTLWDIESNNLLAERADRRDLLVLVLDGIATNGPDDTYGLSLDVEDDHGEVRTIAFGAELAELARRELFAKQPAG